MSKTPIVEVRRMRNMVEELNERATARHTAAIENYRAAADVLDEVLRLVAPVLSLLGTRTVCLVRGEVVHEKTEDRFVFLNDLKDGRRVWHNGVDAPPYMFLAVRASDQTLWALEPEVLPDDGWRFHRTQRTPLEVVREFDLEEIVETLETKLNEQLQGNMMKRVAMYQRKAMVLHAVATLLKGA